MPNASVMLSARSSAIRAWTAGPAVARDAPALPVLYVPVATVATGLHDVAVIERLTLGTSTHERFGFASSRERDRE